MSEPAYRPAAAPRPRRRGFVVALVTLAVLAGLLVAADRGGQFLANRMAGEKLKSLLHTSQTPTVTFHGVPWLTQAVGQKFDHVSIRADHPTIRGYELEQLDAELYGLAATLKMKTAVADRMTGTTRMSWQFLSDRTGIAISDAGTGKVRVKYPVQLMGKAVDATVIATPRLQPESQTIQFTEPQLEVLGVPMPADLSQQILARVVRPVKLPLPPPLRATEMTLSSQGPALAFAGEHVDLMSLGH